MERYRSISRVILFAVLVACVPMQGCTSFRAGPEQLRDPVCGHPVQPDQAILRIYDRWEFYFDSEDCAQKFDAHPARYIDTYYYVLENQDGS
jgi:YHS domain-containing protein